MVDPSVSLTDRIAETLRDQIQSGAYIAEEGRMPSEVDQATHFGVHRGTVRNALAQLIAEGLVAVRPGRGYFVRRFEPLDWWPGTFEHLAHRRDHDGAGADAWAADVIHRGGEPRQDVDVSIVDPSPRVATYLCIPPGETVVVRRRLRWSGKLRVHTADSYYPIWVAEGSPIMTPGDVTIPGGLMAAAGHQQRWFDDTIEIRMPSREEVSRLDLQPGTPVAVHWRVGFDAQDRPVRCIVTTLPGNRNRIRMRFPADEEAP